MIKKSLAVSDSLLISAVLDRMGSAQAQVLLDQVKSSVSQHDGDPQTEWRRTERRRGGIGSHNLV
jgi:hypothetical protein